jgi:RNA polymerase sigma-70 factor (ECF subfamily)
MDRDSELALVARLRAGDTGAFDAVYAEFNARLFSFLARLARRRDVAEDLLEETWMRLVAQAGRLTPETRLGPWLFTVARNLHTSYRRSRMMEESHAGGFVGLWPAGLPQRSPFEETAANEMERRLEAALAALPVASREVLLLVAIEGMRPADAAVVCGITSEAVRQRLSRARAQLARELDDAPLLQRRILREVMP